MIRVVPPARLAEVVEAPDVRAALRWLGQVFAAQES